MKHTAALALAAGLLGLAAAQQAGWSTPENKPRLNLYECTTGGCNAVQRSATMDANWRWLHQNNGNTNCYSGNTWNRDFCSSPESCAQNCQIDGCDYQNTYGVSSTGDALTLRFVTHGQYSTTIGSRLFMMASDDRYQMFKLLNREFAFDVDVSRLPCGLNGAVYFSEMAEDGGYGKGNNRAGARYGTGYCDAQCPHDIKFIDGAANLIDWKPNANDRNSGKGKWGSCCGEMDVWESNKVSTAVTPHNCAIQGPKRCEDPVSCGDQDSGNRYKGLCDKDGCDFNAYRMGDKDFFGPGKKVDTTRPFTVVTQFVSSDNTDNGDLVEIRRFYKQDGKVIENAHGKTSGLTQYNSVTTAMCKAQKSVFGDPDDFGAKGGLKAHGEMLKRGMVLVMSLWHDHDVNMLWLDSNMPANADASKPGVARGTCATTSGVPADLERNSPSAYVVYSNIKFGPLGSTTPGVPAKPDDKPVASSSKPVHHSSSAKCPTHSDDFIPGSASAVVAGFASAIVLAAQL
eukprot:m51a1_g14113 putative glycoside hydrolase (514) ;mRNA; f:131806-133416